MKMSSVFPSKYLKADDLPHDVKVVIERIEIERLKNNDTGRDEDKPVLYFRGKDKGLVLNKTNWKTISSILGSDDSDDWLNGEITLTVADVQSFGEMVAAIRVRLPRGGSAPRKQAPAPSPAPAATAPARQADPAPKAADMADDDIPF